MMVQKQMKDGNLIIKVCENRITSDNAAEFEKDVYLARSEEQFKFMVIDLYDVKYMSSAGLRVLMKLYKEDKHLNITNVSDEVYTVFDITGYTDIGNITKKSSDYVSVDKDSLNDTSYPVQFLPVSKMFEERVKEHPDKLAVVSSSISMTYEELNEMANRIANALRYDNIRPDDTIMILLPRSALIYAVNMGILKAGAAFVTVSTEYPDERISYIYKDAGCRRVITTHRIAFDKLDLIIELGKRPLFVENAIASPWADNPEVRIDERDLAYCIYTSGTTGNPKGVLIEQSNLHNFLTHNEKNRETMGLVEHCNVLLANAALTFDVSIMEEFIPLTSGMTIAFASNEEILNPIMMRDFIIKHHVDGMCGTPSYINTLLSMPQLKEALSQIKVYDIGAEAFPSSLYEKIVAVNPDAYIMNGYGPSETTISCTMKVIESHDNVTIGKPNANVYCYIVDDKNNEVPKGELGELVVCGKGVGRGYKNLPEKTAETFITFNGMRAYKTGDYARITENDEIEFHGRRDNQVKYHGLRIELGEIEENMSRSTYIEACVAAVYEDRFLCLYYVPKGDVTNEEIRNYAKEHLAHYMIPDLFVSIPKMPMTANMKIDKKALPKPELPKTMHIAPSTPMQTHILEILQNVAPDLDIGIETDLRDIGITSLDFMVILAQISDEYNIGLNLAELRDHSTVVELEKLILSKPHIGGNKEFKESYPATPMQSESFAMCKLNNPSISLLPFMLVIDLDIDIDRLINAVKIAFSAHPGLFSYFDTDSSGKVIIHRSDEDKNDFDILVTEIKQTELNNMLYRLSTELIDINKKPLFRVCIYKTDEKIYLYIAMSHLIADGDSIDILAEDIATAYEGKLLQKESMSIFDYAEEVYEIQESPLYAQIIKYYRDLLKGISHTTSVPKDETGLESMQSMASISLPFSKTQIETYVKKVKTSANVLFLALFALELMSEMGEMDITLPFAHNGRNDSRFYRLVGFIAGFGLVRLKASKGTTLDEFLKNTQTQVFESMSCQVFPSEVLVPDYPELMSYLYVFQPDSDDIEIDKKHLKVMWLSDVEPDENEETYKSDREEMGASAYHMLFQAFYKENISLAIAYQTNILSHEHIVRVMKNIEKLLAMAIDVDITKLTIGDMIETIK